jgi:uncharacterized membrane protein YphA (DoxX/SURF4 family)
MPCIGNSEPTCSRRLRRAEIRPRPLAVSALLARLALGALFLWAGTLKLSHPRAFAHAVEEYGIVPDGWPLVIVALAIPALEVLAGVGAFFDRPAGYLLMLALLALFTSVLWFGILNHLDVDCGCFSLDEQRGQSSLQAAFARDWVITAGVVWCLIVKRRSRCAERLLETTTKEEQV